MTELERLYLDTINPDNIFGDMGSSEDFEEWLYRDEFGLESGTPIFVPNLINILQDHGYEEFMDIAIEEYRGYGYI